MPNFAQGTAMNSVEPLNHQLKEFSPVFKQGIQTTTIDNFVAKNSELRAEAGILYVLNQLSDDGHVYYPLEKLLMEYGLMQAA